MKKIVTMLKRITLPAPLVCPLFPYQEMRSKKRAHQRAIKAQLKQASNG